MNPALIERLQAISQQLHEAGHGGKSAIMDQAAQELGMSRQTLYKKLELVRVAPARKRRCDRGQFELDYQEALTISTAWHEQRRKTGKRLLSLESVLEVLRSNGEVLAGRLDAETGELRYLHASTVSRVLKRYGLHPDQVTAPSPKVHLRSLHPNHVWQLDPSLCVLYYLPSKKGEVLQVMDEAKFYKNKPANIRRIEKERVWRYVITDHTSGVIFVHYVLGAESGKNMLDSLILAMQKRHAQDPFHGVPRMLMVDPGSANIGSAPKNLCKALGIQLLVNKPGQPWAKGQVEKANDQVEREFEGRLRFAVPPDSVEGLNLLAARWMRHFNATKIHSRHGKTRYAKWLEISQEQLMLSPEPAALQDAALMVPKFPVVTPQRTIRYQGNVYSVAELPVLTGSKVETTRNLWESDQARVFYVDDEGQDCQAVLAPLERDANGFFPGPEIGKEYRSHANTLADKNRAKMLRHAMGAETDEEAEAKRKKQNVLFEGRIDPFKPITDTRLPEYLPKRGTEHDMAIPKVEALRLTPVQIAMRLNGRFGDDWKPEYFQWLQQRYPEGAPEDQLDDIEAALRRPQGQPLRVVNGGDQG